MCCWGSRPWYHNRLERDLFLRVRIQQGVTQPPILDQALHLMITSLPDRQLRGRPSAPTCATGMGVFNLCCPGSDRIEVVKTWMDAMAPDGNRIYIGMTSADQRQLAFLIDRSLLERSAVFKFSRSFKAVMAGKVRRFNKGCDLCPWLWKIRTSWGSGPE